MPETIEIMDGVSIFERNGIWQFQMWLATEKRMVRETLKTKYQRDAVRLAQKKWAEIINAKDSGRNYFSMTALQGVQSYMDYKSREIGTAIKEGRFQTMQTHLDHFVRYVGGETKLKDMHLDSCAGYFLYRCQDKQKSQITLANEKSTINAMMGHLYKRGEVRLAEFEFPKLNKYELDLEAVRRQTLTMEEYNRLIRVLRGYVSSVDSVANEREHYTRQLMRYYVLISANSGLRTGELQKLRWANVSLSLEKPDHAKEGMLYANIVVLDHTSKTKRTRRLKCRGGKHFKHWKEYSGYGANNDLVFSLDGVSRISNRLILYHWHRLMDLAKVEDYQLRKIVPYSLRHFMITQRLLSGLSYEQVSKMCGTGRDQVERVYSHVTEESLKTAAYADYKRNTDGSVTPI